MTPIPQEEILAANRWRMARDLTLEELADATGFSISAVMWFLRGKSPPRDKDTPPKPVNPRAWKRWKQLCELVDLRRKTRQPDFNW